MVSSDARQQTGRPQGGGRPAFDLVAAKLLRPLMRHGTVRRSPLIERLARTDSRPVVSALYLREGGTLGQAAASFGAMTGSSASTWNRNRLPGSSRAASGRY